MGMIDIQDAKRVIMDEIDAPDWLKSVVIEALSGLPKHEAVKNGGWVRDGISIRCTACGHRTEYQTWSYHCGYCGAKWKDADGT